MNENQEFRLSDAQLDAISGGASGTVMQGEALKALKAGKCPACQAALMQVAQTGQQAGTGNIITTYACPSCSKIYQKITYLSGEPLWGEIHL